jgi:hypothetical protein
MDHDDQPQLRTARKGLREGARDINRPQVLILDIDERLGLGERLRYPRATLSSPCCANG